MKRLMGLDEVKEACQEGREWSFMVSAYTSGREA